ncbi:MAG TPA: sigma-70 family RNA polymerase sigma factor [Polyangiaceae bacterium]|nr:sigma-70 family RNA polymerase sigma factor [Polyangiaceae bacterium]
MTPRSALAINTRPQTQPPALSGVVRLPSGQRLELLHSSPGKDDQAAQRRGEAQRDRELIRRAQRGDHAAFNALIRHYEKRALALAFTVLHDENDAQEVVQEAFLRVYRGLAGFNGEAAFFTWLYCIVKNLAIDLLRKPSHHKTERLAPHEFERALEAAGYGSFGPRDPFEQVCDNELGNLLSRCLAELPAYHRGVIVMRELHGYSYEEMAEAMGVSKGTIMSRLFHARRKLQLVLLSHQPEFG